LPRRQPCKRPTESLQGVRPREGEGLLRPKPRAQARKGECTKCPAARRARWEAGGLSVLLPQPGGFEGLNGRTRRDVEIAGQKLAEVPAKVAAGVYRGPLATLAPGRVLLVGVAMSARRRRPR